ncbi:MAG: 3-isopropylmalate dehydratase small subunit [Candidatus Diapherotrites archaeon]
MNKIVQVKGKPILVKGNDIDTDEIIPARFMRTVTFDDLGKFAFYDVRFDENKKEKEHSFNDPKYQGASVLVVNKNFGCGSSREHAPQALMRWGIKAIIGESFAEIFAGTCQMLGIPCIIVSEKIIEKLQESASKSDSEFVVDIENKKIIFNGEFVPIEIPEARRKSLLDGSWDTLGILVSALDKTKEKVSKIPYLNDFK